MPLTYTADEMRTAEAAAVRRGTSYDTLMENAGAAITKALLERVKAGALLKPTSVLILCGKGNNGGDGLVIARLLAPQGIEVSVTFVLGTEHLSDLSRLNLERLSGVEGIEFIGVDELLESSVRPDWIIDGVFGTGYKGELEPVVAQAFQAVLSKKAYRIAIDIPSGIACDTGEVAKHSFEADVTYALGAYKPAHHMESTQPYCGKVICLDIGI